MNLKDENRGSSGISILWPNLQNAEFQKALEECNQGNAFNNLSAVIRYDADSNPKCNTFVVS